MRDVPTKKKSMRLKVTLVPGVLGVPNGSTMTPGEGRNRKLNSELANGRLAAGLNGLKNKIILISMDLDHYGVKAKLIAGHDGDHRYVLPGAVSKFPVPG